MCHVTGCGEKLLFIKRDIPTIFVSFIHIYYSFVLIFDQVEVNSVFPGEKNTKGKQTAN